METARRPHYRVTFAVLAAGVGAFALLQSLVIPVLTTVQHELHTTQDAVTWVLTAYLLSASICTPILGRVGDMIGKERVFVAALVELSRSDRCWRRVAPNLGVMIVARAIQGLGGGMLPLGFGIIRDEFLRPEKVAGTVGILAALTAVGGSLGIVLAGPIVNALNWHWLFWLPAIATVIAAIGAVLFVPQSPCPQPGHDQLAARQSCCPAGCNGAAGAAERGVGLGLGLVGRSSGCSRRRCCSPPPGSGPSCTRPRR